MTDKLKPCPFCGGKAVLSSWHKSQCMKKGEIRAEVYCYNCVARSSVYRSEAEAIAAWNRRAQS